MSKQPNLAEFTIEPEDAVSMIIVDTPLTDELAEISKSPGDRMSLLCRSPAKNPDRNLK